MRTGALELGGSCCRRNTALIYILLHSDTRCTVTNTEYGEVRDISLKVRVYCYECYIHMEDVNTVMTD